MRDVYGLAAAMLAASIISPFGDAHVRTEGRQKATPRPISPNDHGPVIDTTRESKRARRRRLAKATITTSGAALRQKSDVPTDVNDMPEGEKP